MRTTLAVLAALTLALTGCTAGSDITKRPGDDTEATPVTDIDGEWQLTKASDGGGPMPITGVPVTLAVNGEDVAGQAPCNYFEASLTLAGDAVSFELKARSDVACPENDHDALEARYLAALAAATEARRAGDVLTLSGRDVTLRYTVLPRKSVD